MKQTFTDYLLEDIHHDLPPISWIDDEVVKLSGKLLGIEVSELIFTSTKKLTEDHIELLNNLTSFMSNLDKKEFLIRRTNTIYDSYIQIGSVLIRLSNDKVRGNVLSIYK